MRVMRSRPVSTRPPRALRVREIVPSISGSAGACRSDGAAGAILGGGLIAAASGAWVGPSVSVGATVGTRVCVGSGVGVAVRVGVGRRVAVGESVGAKVGAVVAVGVGVAVGSGVGVIVGVGYGVAVGVGDAVAGGVGSALAAWGNADGSLPDTPLWVREWRWAQAWPSPWASESVLMFGSGWSWVSEWKLDPGQGR